MMPSAPTIGHWVRVRHPIQQFAQLSRPFCNKGVLTKQAKSPIEKKKKTQLATNL